MTPTQTLPLDPRFTSIFEEGTTSLKALREKMTEASKAFTEAQKQADTLEAKLQGALLAVCSMEKIDLDNNTVNLSEDNKELLVFSKEVVKEKAPAKGKAVKAKM